MTSGSPTITEALGRAGADLVTIDCTFELLEVGRLKALAFGGFDLAARLGGIGAPEAVLCSTNVAPFIGAIREHVGDVGAERSRGAP